MKLFVGVTDYDWFQFLSRQANLAEVNFWQPGGRTQFKALKPGELFLFKLHAPRNFIVGGGLFARASILPASLAWEAFGQANGATSLEMMRQRIGKYRREAVEPKLDYHIGCRVIAEPFFLPESQWIPVPNSWSSNIVSGKLYDTSDSEGRYLWDVFSGNIAFHRSPSFAEPRYGEPTLIRPRLGQGAFRVAVTEAYDKHCTVTGEKTLPILDAAHIRPYSEGGDHDVSNGLLLRTDVHKLFDLGYVTVDAANRFVVGRRLKEDFENGRHYYEMHGKLLSPPKSALEMPDKDALAWHQTCRFLG